MVNVNQLLLSTLSDLSEIMSSANSTRSIKEFEANGIKVERKIFQSRYVPANGN